MSGRRRLSQLAALLLAAAPSEASAAPDVSIATPSSGVEAVAFEVPGCRYCEVFRRDVLPTYNGTPAGKQAPLRFVDLNEAAAASLKLAGPITIVPTVVLLKDGVELGRIPGYVGRQNFHHIMDSLLGSQ